MNIPEYYDEFLKKRDSFGYLASLKNDKLCDVSRTSGVYVQDKEFLKIVYMPSLSPNLLPNLLINPQLTVTAVSAYSFECYQFKGNFVSKEKLSADDIILKDKYLKGMVGVIQEMGFSLEKILNEKYVGIEVDAILMKVEELYDQTPKVGAGEKISN